MSNAVYVVGAGVISAIGNNVAENLHALETGTAGMGKMTLLDSIHKETLPVAEVKLSNEELSSLTGLPTKITRTALLSLVAAKEAIIDAAINTKGLRTGFISANSVGGMDKTENFYTEFRSNKNAGKLHDVVNHECGRPTEIVADALGIKHFVTTISTACSSSANAIFLGARMIKNNMLDIVIAGGVDALTKFTLNGFNSLMILDNEFCKPFDENRKGLNLGEGAGYIVMVSEKVAKELSSKIYCTLSGWCNANDAYHQTASSPTGTGSLLAMKGALQKANLSARDIDYINLHGTGTQNNDIAEGTAINTLFTPHFPKMSSTKSFTGHTLGASGGVEAVFSALSVKHGLIYPNLRFHTQMKELPFAPQTIFLKDQQVQNVMSNSFGFGGNCSSLIFSRV
ncbi:beta-ketoacyl-[acyl-carrier-protein] synthase family protein [Panacibacter ginsenosidivorans]|uniref:Beta-ketoacyl-[acyl-carrier-protein] synthase family protein n=1 Tax=Panacibacter ginsenosidivorans TaxID=1813871 RepID=A0A5B8VGM5_9BACT|nr:beta-ketoacyl-[acyl-carrier-protein] synthase family protein [Panacibacter ginsenosidivorans]QEC69458.1 beta-ketoacyl-[acyl-carrier-protein] synthase family protein [Panacibacter ginsenosidivorans]